MSFDSNFKNMFNMNTMMNLGSMAGMGGFGGLCNFTGINSYSTGYNPFVGSVFSFYGSGCCDGANYSTRTSSETNGWEPLGAILGYTALMAGVPLLTKGTGKLINHIKSNTNGAKQAVAKVTLEGLREEKANLLANLNISEGDLENWNKKNDNYAQTLKSVCGTKERILNTAMTTITAYSRIANPTPQETQNYEDARKNLTTYKEEVEKAKNEYDKYVAERENAQQKLTDLNDKIEAEEARLEDLQLNDLDGLGCSRSSETRLKRVFEGSNRTYTVLKKPIDADFRAVIKGYRTADSQGKLEWKAKFIALYDKKYPANGNKSVPSWIAEAKNLIV